MIKWFIIDAHMLAKPGIIENSGQINLIWGIYFTGLNCPMIGPGKDFKRT